MKEEKVFFTNASGLKLCGILHTPGASTEKCIILCHGFGSDKDAHGVFVDLSHELVNAGVAVFRFDFTARGESEGNPIDVSVLSGIEDITAAIEWVKTQGYTQFGIVANSFSGGVALMYAGQHPTLLDAIMLWNPVIDYEWENPLPFWSTHYWDVSKQEEIKKKGFSILGEKKIKIGQQFVDDIYRYKPWQEIDMISAPIMMIHGDADTVIGFDQTDKYAKMFDIPLIKIIGADHGFTNDYKHEQEANRTTVEFFLKNMI